MVVIFGLMATGKTTLARALGQALGLPVVESDRVRKLLAGLEPTTRAAVAFGQGIYAADFSARTYAEMRRQAAALRQGDYQQVFVDQDGLVFSRQAGASWVLVAINASAQEKQLTLRVPACPCDRLVDMLDDRFVVLRKSDQIDLTIPPYWGRVLAVA